MIYKFETGFKTHVNTNHNKYCYNPVDKYPAPNDKEIATTNISDSNVMECHGPRAGQPTNLHSQQETMSNITQCARDVRIKFLGWPRNVLGNNMDSCQDEAELVLRIVFQIQFRNLGFRDTNLNVPCSTSLKRAGEVGRFVLSTLEKRVRG